MKKNYRIGEKIGSNHSTEQPPLSSESKKKSIISSHIRVRHPQHFEVGAGSVVDDFCYFSTQLIIGRCCHIASGCSVAGGISYTFKMGDFSSLSSGVKIWCGSDDFVNDIVTIIPPGAGAIKANFIGGDVILEDCTAVGSNAVIMPNNRIPEGSVIGALSFVPSHYKFEPWSVYAGVPIKKIGLRNRTQVSIERDKLNDYLRKVG